MEGIVFSHISAKVDMAILDKVDKELKRYNAQNDGASPLYILVSIFEADALWKAIRKKAGLQFEAAITSYKGSKVVENLALKKGDLHLSNELPESGS